jgi:hypothetical protein
MVKSILPGFGGIRPPPRGANASKVFNRLSNNPLIVVTDWVIVTLRLG